MHFPVIWASKSAVLATLQDLVTLQPRRGLLTNKQFNLWQQVGGGMTLPQLHGPSQYC